MDMMQLLFSFKGRVPRKTYWIFMLIAAVLIFLPGYTVLEYGSREEDNYTTLISLILLWPALAIQAKRWHDRDKSALWLLINFIPFIGGLWALIDNGFLVGTEGSNNYGPDPVVRNQQET